MAPRVQLAVYRMIQEALTNVLKHAPAAAQAAVNLRYRPGGIDLEIENDDEATPQRPATTSTAPATGRGLATRQIVAGRQPPK